MAHPMVPMMSLLPKCVHCGNIKTAYDISVTVHEERFYLVMELVCVECGKSEQTIHTIEGLVSKGLRARVSCTTTPDDTLVNLPPQGGVC